MTEEVYFVEISVEEFMDKFFPVSGNLFDPTKYDTALETTHLDVKESDLEMENACYPDLVRGIFYVLNV